MAACLNAQGGGEDDGENKLIDIPVLEYHYLLILGDCSWHQQETSN